MSARTHGCAGLPVYQRWAALMARCYNPERKDYHYYGGRGIGVCKRWHKFENFLKDMGHPPKGLCLDRTNNDRNYSPRNCRWVTRSVSMINRRAWKWGEPCFTRAGKH